jgi:Flp pilus assembly protein TadD
MRPQCLTRFAALLTLLLVCHVGWSQQMSSIVGVARVLRGSFPTPVLVTLQVHGATYATTYTDAEGRFSFNALPANLFHVIINDEHYVPIDNQVVTRPDIAPLTILQLTLVPRETASPKSTGPQVVSASEFKVPKKALKDFERATKEEAEGKSDAAVEDYRKAIKQAPNFALAHNNLGALLVGKSEFAAAQQELEQSMKLDSSDPRPCFNMANLMLLNGKLEEADRYLQDGFRKQPDSAFGLFVQGSVFERAGKLEDAERALRRALQLDPKLSHPHLELVNVYLLANRRADAVAELHAFLHQAPSDPLAPKAREVLARLEATAPAMSK